MAEIQGRERDFVLAPNEYLFVQDQTKGTIHVHVGPFTGTMPPTSQPITYDHKSRKFVAAPDVSRAVQQFPMADEGNYVVLENPAIDNKSFHPEIGASNNFVARLAIGRKINIPGPQTFPLWPGQSAKVIEGHRLRTNQYLLVRVYNDEEAQRNAGSAVIRRTDPVTLLPVNPQQNNTDPQNTQSENQPPQQDNQPQNSQPSPEILKLTMGKLLVIKGDEVSFYIPPTGIEVVPDENGNYVREALTLERLEYCVLLSEKGDKRFVKGPAVVFPEPTETFISSNNNSRKLRAIELNDDMGLYIKVTADYEEDGKHYIAGEELFITGREQRLYYPRAEHSLIKYGDREIHYGIAIPDGEARYVLDKQTGNPELVRGPRIFLPDPRKQVVVHRGLTDDEVKLWYPGNQRALEHNSRLRELQKQYSDDMVTDESMRMLSNVPGRRATRSVASESAVAAFSGDQFDRGINYTPPRTITLDTKYDGAVALNIWNGYAILINDKNGNQRVEVGPKTVLLEYDETLQVLQLSTGKPKTTDKLERTVYLRVSFNQVSDMVEVVTKDMVTAVVKLSYRVNFVGEPSKWFSVENYVKFMCDHARSLLRNAAKRTTIDELNANYIDIVRNTVLGTSEEGQKRKGKLFEENGVNIYDVEVSSITIGDSEIEQLLNQMQQAAVRQALQVASKERELEAIKRTESIEREIADQKEDTAKHLHGKKAVEFEREKEILESKVKIQAVQETAKDETNNRQMARDKAVADQQHSVEIRSQELKTTLINTEVEAVVKKAGAISPQLIAALQQFGDTKLAADLAISLSPMALLGGSSVADVLSKVLRGTALEKVISDTLGRINPSALPSRTLSSGVANQPSAPGNGPIQ